MLKLTLEQALQAQGPLATIVGGVKNNEKVAPTPLGFAVAYRFSIVVKALVPYVETYQEQVAGLQAKAKEATAKRETALARVKEAEEVAQKSAWEASLVFDQSPFDLEISSIEVEYKNTMNGIDAEHLAMLNQEIRLNGVGRIKLSLLAEESEKHDATILTPDLMSLDWLIKNDIIDLFEPDEPEK